MTSPDLGLYFRTANQDDLDIIVTLNSQFNLAMPNFYWDQPEWVSTQIEHARYFVLINPDNLVIGAICLTPLTDTNQLNLETLAINPQHHGQGLGKKMIEFAKQKALEGRCESLIVETFQCYKLEAFYLKCGFSKDEPYILFENGEPYYRFKMKLEAKL
ncbi:MAG TPA: GNAT family N-acetyltransferase [Vitreimonas sp.]|nr:GNAT family N-acetyltransferase [Vitreimonas sp.]